MDRITIEETGGAFVLSVNGKDRRELHHGDSLVVTTQDGHVFTLHNGSAKTFLEQIPSNTILEVLRDRLRSAPLPVYEDLR